MSSDRSSRRGSAALIAMRRRTLSEETSEEVRERRSSTSSRRASMAQEKLEAAMAKMEAKDNTKSFAPLPTSPLSPTSLSMTRNNRRRSIAELADKAGLGNAFGKLEEKRRGSMVGEISPGGTTTSATSRRGKQKSKKEDR